MLCASPFRQGAAEFGCARCIPCKVNRRRLWATRMQLESVVHPAAVFCTLTLEDDYRESQERRSETGVDSRSVCVRETQLWIKRVRDIFDGQRIRYFAVGEYGDATGRPHYHAVLFGPEGLYAQGWLERSWPYGLVHMGFGQWETFSYITGYVSKGMTRAEADRLNGRAPEFARMSLRPRGLGDGALDAIAKWCVSKQGAVFIAKTGDVPRSVRVNGRVVPLGRYLTHRLRERVGIEVPDQGEKLSHELYLELIVPGAREVREAKRRQGEKQTVARLKLKTRRL